MKNDQLIIIGKGPAGLSAGIYAGRAGIGTTVIGCAPKVAGDYHIDNYFGFPETITGGQLIELGTKQAQRFGVTIREERVLGVHQTAEGFEVQSEQGHYPACAIILATGVSRIRPGIENLDAFEGNGVSYCVSCDGFFFRNKTVMVVGEGNYAANQALELKQYTPHVSICSQKKPLQMTPEFVDKLRETDITVTEEKIERLVGEETLEGVVFAGGGQAAADGLFVAMGQASAADFAMTLGLERNGEFIQADNLQQTNIPGVFAAGDCVGRFLQISVAVGEGALAARAAIRHIKSHCRQ